MKQYNGEKAIISLTSWKKRIHNVGRTIFSLYKNCPGFHIVLVLAEDEFPQKEKELPEVVNVLSNQNIIEILWVKKNLKALKKVLYTMQKYKTVPIISADDDCKYICNYAQELYDKWLKDKTKFVTVNSPHRWCTVGANTLFPPNCFGDNAVEEMENNKHLDMYQVADDAYYEMLRCKIYRDKNMIVSLPRHKIWDFGDEIQPLGKTYNRDGFLSRIRRCQSEDCGLDVSRLFRR